MSKELKSIFDQLKPILNKYEPPLTASHDFDSRYELWSEKEIELNGKKRDKVFFASIIIQSNYVGLYHMPYYADTEVRKNVKPELLKLLKGKSCFHIKNLDQKLLKQIKATLENGFKVYKKREWI